METSRGGLLQRVCSLQYVAMLSSIRCFEDCEKHLNESCNRELYKLAWDKTNIGQIDAYNIYANNKGFAYLEAYMRDPKVREALHIPSNVGDWQTC